MNYPLSTRIRRVLLVSVLALGLLTVLAGCGSGSPGRYGVPPPTPPTTSPTALPGY